jgi:hypothetical protein
MYRNMASFIKFWSSYYGYWKSEKAVDILAFKIFNVAFWLYEIASPKKKV